MPRIKRRILVNRRPILLAVAAIVVIFIFWQIFSIFKPLTAFTSQNKLSPFSFLSLLFERKPKVETINGRANFVFLGISGGNHAGANLTDSIIFISLDFEKKDALMVSIPRDIWLPSLKTKINSAYHYGEEKEKGGGLILAKSAVSEVLGQPVLNAFVLDFETFKKIIDLIGGIEVNVSPGFEDKFYPIPGMEDDFCGGDPEFLCRYETIRFASGSQIMDGEKALKFVRSRFSGDGNGTDFSRSRRQQLVINSIIGKMKNLLMQKKFDLLKSMFDLGIDSLETDMEFPQILSLAKFFYFNRDMTVRQAALDSGDDVKDIAGLLENPPLWEYDGIWVLVPRNGDFEEIHRYISCQMEGRTCPVEKLN